MNVLSILLETKQILIIAGAVLIFALVCYIVATVGLHASYKKRLKDLERKYNYLHSLLNGQDSSYLKRVETVSQTNLLYVEKYDSCFRQYKEIFESDDVFASSMIDKVKSLIKSKTYKNVKIVLSDAFRAVKILDNKLTKLDKELYELVKPEEESRQQILSLKEIYRNTKQSFYAVASEVELCTPSIIKAFDKIDAAFGTFEGLLENGIYDEANSMIPHIQKVIHAIDTVLIDMPNLCALVTSIVPNKIQDIQNDYFATVNSGIPLQNLKFEEKLNKWNNALEVAKTSLIELRIKGVGELLENVQDEINNVKSSLTNEETDKCTFENECERTYRNVVELEKSFVRICSLVPQLKTVYVIKASEEAHLTELKKRIDKLSASKRNLDAYIHAAASQPYSVLMQKLNELKKDYDGAYNDIKDFKGYIDYLRGTADDAYETMFTYYKRCINTEYAMREIDVAVLTAKYTEEIDNFYAILNEMDYVLKTKPIDVERLVELMDVIQTTANSVFDEFENKIKEVRLAETAILYSNRDRLHRMDIHQQLLTLEESFDKGEFLHVYHEANELYKREHQNVGTVNNAAIK